MAEKEREQPRESPPPAKEKTTVTWRVGGREAEDVIVEPGTKLSDFLREKGHANLLRKKLFRNGNLVATDEQGNLKEDPELQEGDLLVLFEAEIVKGA